MTHTEISSTDDMIYINDIITRVEELEAAERDGNENAELKTLADLLAELRGNGGDEEWRGDWYPVMLIRDTHFVKAMDELLADIGVLPKNLPSYLTITVDYDALQSDYTRTVFDRVTYWYR